MLKWDSYRIEGLLGLVWGPKVKGTLECPDCGSHNIYYSGTSSDPDEILGESVRCGDCGWLTDYYEMHKQAQIKQTGVVR